MSQLAQDLPAPTEEPAFRRRPLTADEVMRMVQAGILSEDEPVELIDGELIAMSPQGRRHSALVVHLHRLLDAAFGDTAYVQDHSPIDAGPNSLPEPDLAVVRGAIDFDRHPDPSRIALVVEVSVSSQRVDRAKAAVYARAGIERYWNLDVVERRLTVYTHPSPTHGEYGEQRMLREGDTVEAGGGELEVAALLAPI